MRRLLSLLMAERGSAAASVVFTLFTALTLTAVTAAVVASMSITTATANQTSANTATLVLQERYLASLAEGTAVPGEACTGPFCAQVIGSSDSGGIRLVTFGNAGTPGTTEERTLRPVSGTMITGFDQLGRPVWTDRSDLTPHRFEALAASSNHSCAIDAAKAVWCWGANNHGQLGDGTTTDNSAPVKSQTPALVTRLVSGGVNTSCGLTDSGKALCWGENQYGQLGTGASEVGKDATTPVEPLGGHAFSSLAQSSTTTCGIDDAKKTWCWGANPGNGTSDSSATPVEVEGGHEFISVALGASTACGIDAGGKAWCWSATASGRTGTDPAPAPGTPVEVSGGRTYTALNISQQADPAHPVVICALDTSAATWCWGHNGDGQLGDGTGTDSLVPVQVAGEHRFSTLAITASSSCGITDTSHLWCWGNNSNGQVGNNSATAAKEPVAIDPATTFKSITTGQTPFVCALTAAGEARCWGSNADGQVSPGTAVDVPVPTAVPGLGVSTTVAAGGNHACAVDIRSGVTCWGRNVEGQAGSGTTAPTMAPGFGIRKEIAPSSFQGFVKGGK